MVKPTGFGDGPPETDTVAPVSSPLVASYLYRSLTRYVVTLDVAGLGSGTTLFRVVFTSWPPEYSKVFTGSARSGLVSLIGLSAASYEYTRSNGPGDGVS